MTKLLDKAFAKAQALSGEILPALARSRKRASKRFGYSPIIRMSAARANKRPALLRLDAIRI
jgi:hypothetical protein